jgi:hypothetical protein
MACAMVTQAGIPYSSWLATAPGETRKRNCNCCGVNRGERGEGRRSGFEGWGAGGALGCEFAFPVFVSCAEGADTWGANCAVLSFEFPISIVCGAPAEGRRVKVEPGSAVGAAASFEFPVSMIVFGGAPAESRRSKFETWSTVWGLVSFEFPFSIFVYSVALAT